MGTARSAPGIFTLSKKVGSMNKGTDRSAKAFFSVEENAREMVKLAFSELGLDAEPKEVRVEDPVVSYLDDNLSLEVAAEALNLSLEEYARREERFFS